MRGKWLRRFGYAIAVGTIVLAVALASRFGTDPGLVESPLIGQQAPEFDLPTLTDEANFKLADSRGDIVVVNFFASWCLQCRAEHDDFVASANAFAGQGVTFVQISYQEPPEESLRYLNEVGSSPAIWYLADPQSRTAIAYGVFGIPETFFIDEDGVVVGKIIGETNAITLGATIDAIARGESPGQSVTGDTQQRPDS